MIQGNINDIERIRSLNQIEVVYMIHIFTITDL